MIYMVTLFADDAVARIREVMPASVLKMMDEAKKDEREVSFCFDTEDEAATFARSFFPELIGAMPTYTTNAEDERVVRIGLYRDAVHLERSAFGGKYVAKVEAMPADPVEAANIVMRTVVPFDFNLWMSAERAAQIAAKMRSLLGPLESTAS